MAPKKTEIKSQNEKLEIKAEKDSVNSTSDFKKGFSCTECGQVFDTSRGMRIHYTHTHMMKKIKNEK